MKKILLVALAAAAMVSCSQNEEIDNAAQKVEINFGTVVKTGTKALITTTSSLDEFTVNAYKTQTVMDENTQLSADNALTTPAAFLVSKGDDDSWSTASPVYWPLTDKVQFFATSPAQSLTLPSKGYPTFSYTVGEIGQQKDLIAANVINKAKSDADKTVTFAFQHLLTQVNFSVKGDLADCVYNVTKLELVGIKDQATFTFKGDATVGDWSNIGATTGKYEWTGDLNFTPTQLTDTLAIGKAGEALFMLMPQSLSGASLNITYSAKPAGASDFTFNATKTIALTQTWSKSQNIRYTLKLTSDNAPVTFGTPSVGGWVDDKPSQPEVTPTTQP